MSARIWRDRREGKRRKQRGVLPAWVVAVDRATGVITMVTAKSFAAAMRQVDL